MVSQTYKLIISIAIKYELLYDLSIGIFTFDSGQF